MDYDFPETVGNEKSSQLTSELHHFSEGLVYHQPEDIGVSIQDIVENIMGIYGFPKLNPYGGVSNESC